MSYLIAVSDTIDMSDAQLAAYSVFRMPCAYHGDNVLPPVGTADRPHPFAEYIRRRGDKAARDNAANVSDRLETHDDYDALENEIIDLGRVRTAPSRKDFGEFFDGFLLNGCDGIIFFAPCSVGGGEYNDAMRAAALSMVKFPKKQVYVVNARAFSVGIIPPLLCAVRAARNGATIDEAFVAANEAAGEIKMLVVMPERNSPFSRAIRVLAVDGNGEQKPLFVCRGVPSLAEKLAGVICASSPECVYAAINSRSGRAHLSVIERIREKLPAVRAEAHRMGLFSLTLALPATPMMIISYK